VENVGEGELLVLRKALPEPRGVLPPLPEPTPRPYFENHKLENLRANSFLEEENDVNMGTVLDQGMSKPSNQKSKALNQASKALTEEPLKDGGVLSSFLEPNPMEEPYDSIVFNDSNLNMNELSPYGADDQESNLRANSSQQGENDGDGPMGHYHESQGIPRGPRKRPKVKKKERNTNKQLSILPGQTVSHEPDFVKLIEDYPGGIISCTTHPRKALVASFPTRPVSAHSELIWSPKQPQNRRYIFTGANPAYPVFVQLLANDSVGVSASPDHSILA